MSTQQPASFGDLLRQRRQSAELTQQELAARAGLSRRGISDIERGLKRAPQRATVERLANALHLTGAERAAFEAAAQRQRIPARRSQPPGYRPSAPHPTMDNPTFVGRHTEMRHIERFLTPVRGRQGSHAAPTPRDRPRLLLVAGEPGIGKSRVLREVATHAEAAGWRVLAGRCVRGDGQAPYEPVSGALARHLSTLPRAQQRRELAGCGWLVRLLPELLDASLLPSPTASLVPEQERRLIVAAVRRYLANIAGPAGTLLVLDDLQWAAADALDLCDALIRETTATDLRIVGAYRSTEFDLSGPLAQLLAEATRDELAQHLDLGPLTPAEAAQLLDAVLAAHQTSAADSATGQQPVSSAAPLDATAREELLRRAEGVPFYLISDARALLASAESSDALPMQSWQIPWRVEQSVRTRIALLDEPTRELLAAAAVIGGRIPPDLLIAVTGKSEEVVLQGLEAGCAAGLLVEQGWEYTFTHDLVREVVLAELNGPRLRALHRRVAQALLATPDGDQSRLGGLAAQIAYHFRQAGDDKAALPYVMQVGDRAAVVFAHEEAQHHYRVAITLAAAQHDAQTEAEARLKLGQLLTTTGHLEEGQQMLEAAVAGFRALGNPASVAQAEMALAINLGLSVRVEECIAHLLAVRELIEPVAPPRELALVYHWLSNAYSLIARRGDELEAAEKEVTYARTSGDPAIELQAQMRYGAALILHGRIEEGAAIVERELAAGPPNGDPTDLGSVYLNLIQGLTARGDFAAAERYLLPAVELAERTEHAHGIAWTRLYRGLVALYRGAWDDALADFGAGATFSRTYGLVQVAYFQILHGQLLYLRGEARPDIGTLQQSSLALAEQRSLLWPYWFCQSALAEQELLEGQPDAAARRLQSCLQKLGEEAQFDSAPLLPPLALAYLALGREAEADSTITRAVERASTMEYRVVLVDALRVRALLASQRGQWAEAAAALEQSLVLARAISYPYAEAKALSEYGKLEAARGEPERAREHYSAALAICIRLGERRYAERTERALAALPPEPMDQKPMDQK